MSAPKLCFPPGGQPEGFTPGNVNSYKDLNPAAVVRELIQNALDSSVSAGNDCAKVIFTMSRIAVHDIPAIKYYRDAFEGAVVSQKKLLNDGELPDTHQDIATSMEKELEKDTVWMLSVVDNGVGLDENRMRSLLGDGISYQDNQQATGSNGNGHMVAIPTSQLRYVLYGGITSEGKKICSGHAVIASREGKNSEPLSKDGIYCEKLNNNFLNPYTFIKGTRIPNLIMKMLNAIKSNTQTGTAVIIPCFNRFKQQNFNLWKTISSVSASNFFCAIHRGELEIKTIDEETNENKILKINNVGRVLESISHQQIVKGGFISGSKAYDAHNVLKKEPFVFKTSKGSVKIYLDTNLADVTRIHLCRNGMWITDDIIEIKRNQFTDYQPFTCIISVDESSELQRLIRAAEGPLHNELHPKFLEKTKAQTLKSCLSQIRSELQKRIPKQNLESHWLSNVLVIPGVGKNSKGSKGIQPNFFGIPTAITARVSTIKKRSSKQKKRKRKKPREKVSSRLRPDASRSRKLLQYKAVGVSTGPRSYKARIIPLKDYEQCELRFILNISNETTDSEVTKEPFVTLSKVKLDGKLLQENNMVYDHQPSKRVIGISLRSIKKNINYRVELDFSLPDSISIPDSQNVVLRIELKQSPLTLVETK